MNAVGLILVLAVGFVVLNAIGNGEQFGPERLGHYFGKEGSTFVVFACVMGAVILGMFARSKYEGDDHMFSPGMILVGLLAGFLLILASV